MTINFVKTAPISPLFNCTHMPQGIAINHLNTTRSIPQASLQICLFVFVALRPMSTAMVIAGRSVHLTTLFPGQA